MAARSNLRSCISRTKRSGPARTARVVPEPLGNRALGFPVLGFRAPPVVDVLSPFVALIASVAAPLFRDRRCICPQTSNSVCELKVTTRCLPVCYRNISDISD